MIENLILILVSVTVAGAGIFVGSQLADSLVRRRPTSGGVELTEPLTDRLAAEAESGYDIERLRPRTHRNTPPMGGGVDD